MVELGDKVKDSVTGYKGIVTGISTFLYGCTRVCVQCDELKNGVPQDGVWFDAPQLTIIKKGVVTPEPYNKSETSQATQSRASSTGGPMPSRPTRNAGPTR